MFVEQSLLSTNLLDIKKDFIKACGRYEVFSFIFLKQNLLSFGTRIM